jgi:hypothetical protein
MLKAVGINSPTELVDFMGNVTMQLGSSPGKLEKLVTEIENAMGQTNGLSKLNKKLEDRIAKGGRAGARLEDQNLIQKTIGNITGNTNFSTITEDGTIVGSDTAVNKEAKALVGGIFKKFNIDLDQAMGDGKPKPNPGEKEQTAAIKDNTKSQNSLITALENLTKNIGGEFYGGRTIKNKAAQTGG